MPSVDEQYTPTHANLNLMLPMSTQDISNLVSPLYYEPSISDFQILRVRG